VVLTVIAVFGAFVILGFGWFSAEQDLEVQIDRAEIAEARALSLANRIEELVVVADELRVTLDGKLVGLRARVEAAESQAVACQIAASRLSEASQFTLDDNHQAATEKLEKAASFLKLCGVKEESDAEG
jgi:hypothetical protein